MMMMMTAFSVVERLAHACILEGEIANDSASNQKKERPNDSSTSKSYHT